MFFTLGMPAHVAAAHRHEYSSPRSSPRPSGAYARPSLPRPVSWPAAELSVDESFGADAAPAATMPFADHETEGSSNGMAPRTASVAGTGSSTTDVSVRKSPTRSRTSFQLAHPPPSVIHRQRLHIRPRLLLQLQRLSSAGRPNPTLDVLPSTIFAPKLARTFPKIFRGKDGLGPNDLVVVDSEEYCAQANAVDQAEEDGEESRHVVATICPLRSEGHLQAKAEICLSDGPLWEATSLATGGYQFVAVGEHGVRTTVRWVPRSPAVYPRPHKVEKVPGAAKEQGRLGFSIINPASRRHPIIATMTRSTIDVVDYYPEASPATTAESPTSPSVDPFASPFVEVPQPLRRPMDDALRTLILITGIWVAFREGWSENFKYDDWRSVHAASVSAVVQPASGRRSVSMPLPDLKHTRALSLDAPSLASSARQSSGRSRRSSGASGHASEAPLRDGNANLRTIPKLANPPRRTSAFGPAVVHRPRVGRRVSQVVYPPTIADGDESDQADDKAPVRTPIPIEGTLEADPSADGRQFFVEPGTPPYSLSLAGEERDDTDRPDRHGGGVQTLKKRWGKVKDLLLLVRHQSGTT
ncbi:MAG: hypothetical protein M1838_003833 [Thelocarpon superellum]|nr:MAG: hypothetical protein M1838_003833 [Thelocarpon superellum]